LHPASSCATATHEKLTGTDIGKAARPKKARGLFVWGLSRMGQARPDGAVDARLVRRPLAQRAIQPRSRARACMLAVTQGSVTYERTNRRRRIPIGTAQAWGRVSSASSEFGSRRSGGLSAHDKMTNIRKITGGNHTPTTSPASRCEATAPENWKKAPA